MRYRLFQACVVSVTFLAVAYVLDLSPESVAGYIVGVFGACFWMPDRAALRAGRAA